MVRIKSVDADSENGSDIEVDIDGSDASDSEKDQAAASSVYTALLQAAQEAESTSTRNDGTEQERKIVDAKFYKGVRKKSVSENDESCAEQKEGRNDITEWSKSESADALEETIAEVSVKIEQKETVADGDVLTECSKDEDVTDGNACSDDACDMDGDGQCDTTSDEDRQQEEDAHPNGSYHILCTMKSALTTHMDVNCYDLGVAATILHPMLRSGLHMLRFLKKNMYFSLILLKISHFCYQQPPIRQFLLIYVLPDFS